MTAERLERNRKNSDRLNDVIVWSLQNYDLWFGFCLDDSEQGITTHQISAIIDRCLQKGFMELYYIALIKIADSVEICGDLEQLVRFLEVCVDKNLTLDMERILSTVKQIPSKHHDRL